MRRFTFEIASSPAEATRAVAGRDGARFIGGGTNLLDLMKLGIEQPLHLVDVNRAGLDAVETTADGGLRIGAAVRNTDLAAHSRVKSHYPVLTRAIVAGASGQIRNKATTAGNLLQRTRCPYFYEMALPCNKRAPGTGCAAINGLNRNHAVIGASDSCIATHPSDMAVALLLLDASVETVGDGGLRRSIRVADLHRLPEDSPHLETVLEPGELIEAVTLPPPLGGRQTYRKVRDRSSYAFALVSVAAVLHHEGDRVVAGRIAFGGVAPKPWRVEAAEPYLSQGADAVWEVAFAQARPTPGNAFKLPLARRVLEDILKGGGRP